MSFASYCMGRRPTKVGADTNCGPISPVVRASEILEFKALVGVEAKSISRAQYLRGLLNTLIKELCDAA